MAQRDDALLRAEVLMHVAIRRYDGIEPSAVAEFVRRVSADSGASTPGGRAGTRPMGCRGRLCPPARETPGFEAYYLVDAGNGVVVSISFFGDRDAAEESTRGAAEWVSRNLADLIRLPPQVLTGEVVAEPTTEHPPLA